MRWQQEKYIYSAIIESFLTACSNWRDLITRAGQKVSIQTFGVSCHDVRLCLVVSSLGNYWTTVVLSKNFTSDSQTIIFYLHRLFSYWSQYCRAMTFPPSVPRLHFSLSIICFSFAWKMKEVIGISIGFNKQSNFPGMSLSNKSLM